MTASRRSRPYRLQRLCEQFRRPFDVMDVFKNGGSEQFTMEQIAALLPMMDFVDESAPPSHNRRAQYVFKEDRRSDEWVGTACGPRSCAECHRTIETGERVLDPRPRSKRHRWLCRECGLKALARWMTKLVNG